MITIRNPKGQTPPETYHHGIETSGAVRTLYIAGQIPLAPDGSIPDGIEAQTKLVFDNMKAVLAEAGMTFENLVKTTVYLTRREDRPGYGTVRAAELGAVKCTSTLVYIVGLARPEFLIEIEAVAVAEMGAA